MSRVTRNQEEYLNGQTQEVEVKLLTFEDFRNINVDAPESARDKKARRPVCASGKKSPVWKYFFQAWGLPEGICRFCAQAIVQGSDSTSLAMKKETELRQVGTLATLPRPRQTMQAFE